MKIVEVAYTYNGIEFHANSRGVILWLSDWGRVDELIAAGLAKWGRVIPGTYGHQDLEIDAAAAQRLASR